MNDSVNADLVPSYFQNTDNELGAQSLDIKDAFYLLKFDSRKFYVHVSKLMQERNKNINYFNAWRVLNTLVISASATSLGEETFLVHFF